MPPPTAVRQSPSSTLSPSATNKSSRLPPPTLFQGPPSRNASGLSLALPSRTNSITSNNGPEFPSAKTPTPQPLNTNPLGAPSLSANGPLPALLSPRLTPRLASFPRRPSHAAAPSENDRADDAVWIEMQNTLAEVELSAENAGNVFGGEHAKALEELRAKQMELARAWARSEEADELGLDGQAERRGHGNEEEKGQSASVEGATTGGGNRGSGGTATQSPETTGPGTTPSAGGTTDRGTNIEEETQADMLMAQRRREANDRYFHRVNAGVLDVVAKLEEVSLAMRRVEKESRDIWSETESIASTNEGDG